MGAWDALVLLVDGGVCTGRHSSIEVVAGMPSRRSHRLSSVLLPHDDAPEDQKRIKVQPKDNTRAAMYSKMASRDITMVLKLHYAPSRRVTSRDSTRCSDWHFAPVCLTSSISLELHAQRATVVGVPAGVKKLLGGELTLVLVEVCADVQ